MKVDSEIIIHKEPYGEVYEWKGDQRHGTAVVPHTAIRNIKFVGDYSPVFYLGDLRLRLVAKACESACMTDYWYVKLDTPFSALYELYREKAEKLIRLILRCEAAIHAFKLRRFDNFKQPFTNRLRSKLL